MGVQVDFNARLSGLGSSSGDGVWKDVSGVSTRHTNEGHDAGELLPIDQVARRFGVKASTLRYYDERGLVRPVSRQGGRRWYGPREVRRVAIIRFWQRKGLTSLDLIGELLDSAASSVPWQQLIQRHIDAMQQEVDELQRAQAVISESLACEYHDSLDDCPDYERMIWEDADDHTPLPAFPGKHVGNPGLTRSGPKHG